MKDLIIPCEINVRAHDEFVLINFPASIIIGVEFGCNNILKRNATVSTGIQCNATHEHLNLHSEMLLAVGRR